MPLHPQSQSFLDQLAQQNPPSWEQLGVDDARAVFDSLVGAHGESPPVSRVEDHSTPDGIRLRLYVDHADPRPVVMFFHGGGWVLGNIASHDALCRRFAIDSGCAVVSVDYGLSPENSFPGPIDDCYRATQFVVDNASLLNVDASRLAVAGDSAGGYLATAVAIRARDRSGPQIALQTLFYPVIEPHFETESYREFSQGYGLTRDSMRWFWNQFLGDQPASAASVPSRTPSLAGLPAALIVTAEYDVLRDEGNAYASQLQAAGVPVTHLQCDGVLHGFVHFAGLFDRGLEIGRDLAQQTGQRLRA
ncbi:alpha/beta hydrolase [Stieleria sp. TO1_6]|uniref:alpha/beta hydrolase n=1 Tax=Stieleria tagensis TaxID=2956795 RepID=UPI00209B9DBC|nr:alpha/beta hydrolase [Stieleria tagensis]MCO8122074.1 alpha/beta hydrolase [Stieleria tagensis]